jgi:hypothetical protein
MADAATEAAELALAEEFERLARGLREDRRAMLGGEVCRADDGRTVFYPDWRE